MTEKAKENANWAKQFINLGITPIMLIALFFKYGYKEAEINGRFESIEEKIEQRAFPSPLVKFQVMDHVTQSKTELELYKTQQTLDTIVSSLAIELLEKSKVKEMTERNAVQIYQIKENQTKVLQKLDEIQKKQQ